MKNTTRVKAALAFIIFVISFKQISAQTCGSPVSVPSASCTATHQLYRTPQFLGFTATDAAMEVKIYIQDISINPSYEIKMYNNVCASLATNELFPSITFNGDTAIIFNGTCTVSNNYLIRLTDQNTYNPSDTTTDYAACLRGLPTPASIGTCPSTLTPTSCELICNGGFESQNGSPGNFAAVDAWGWGSLASPDFFSASTPGVYGVPCNQFGYQNAHGGNNYAGIIQTQSSTNYAEYIETQFVTPMVNNMYYEVSFWVSQSDFTSPNVSDIGAVFLSSAGPASTTNHLSFPIYSVETNSAIINDVNNWQKVTFCYKSQYSETHLLIGDVTYAPITSTVTTPASISGCVNSYSTVLNDITYLYIDDVSVVPFTPSLTAATNTCSGLTSFTVSSTCSSFTSAVINWDFGDGTTLNNLGSNPAHTYTASGTYTTVASIVLSCGTITLSTAVTIPTLNVVSALASPSIICAANTSTLSVTGLSSYTFQPGNLSTPPIVVSPLSNTTYTVSGTSSTGCPGSATVQVAVNPAPSLTVSATDYTICSSGTSTLTASGATSYTWQPGSATGSALAASPTVTTIYTVTGTSAAGCTGSSTVQINVNAVPSLTVTKSTLFAVCPATSVSLSLSGATSYTTNPGSFTINPVVVSPTVSTTYTVTGTSLGSGCTNTVTSTISVLTPTNTVSYNTSSVICTGGTVSLHSSALNTYTWSGSSITGSPNTQDIVAAPTSNAIYTVNGTYSPFNCPASATIAVTVNPLPTLSITASPNPICPGGSSTLTASGASTYTWSPGSSTVTPLAVSPTVTTTYTLTGTSVAGCTNTAVSTITVNAYPNVTASASSATLCPGQTTSLTTTGATSWTWAPGAATVSPFVVTPSVSTNYTIHAFMAACSTITVMTVPVIVNQATLNPVASPSVICPSQSSTITASGFSGGSFTLTPGPSTGTAVVVSPTVSTNYTLSGVYSALSCPATATVNVLVVNTPSALTVSSSTGNFYICSGSTATLSTNITVPSAYTFLWAPLGGSSPTATISPTDNNIYTCTVTETLGCGGGTLQATFCVDVTASLCCVASNSTISTTTISGAPYDNLNSIIVDVYGTVNINTYVTWTDCSFRMHNGSRIDIAPGATLVANNCNFFSCEDMWQGITVFENTGTGIGGVINMNGGSIEDAYIGIHYDAMGDPFQSNVQIGHATFNKNYKGVEVDNVSAVSSGNFLFTGAASNYLSQASGTSPGSNLKCSSFYSPTIMRRGSVGIYLESAAYGLCVCSGTPNTLPSYDNYFENLDNGVYLKESGVDIYNAGFYNMDGYNRNLALMLTPATNTGVAVYGTSTVTGTPSANNKLHVEFCDFENVWRGVATFAMTNVVTLNSVFNSSVTSGPGCGGNCIGNTAVFYNDSRDKSRASLNTIDNYYSGILTYYSFVAASSTFTYGVGNNTITASTGDCNQAIQLMDASTNFTASATLSVVANQISGADNGISVVGVQKNARLSNNNVALLYSSFNPQWGISFQGTAHGAIDNNTVTSTSTGNAALRGIYMESSPLCRVTCNYVDDVGQGYVYNGNCIQTVNGWVHNTVNNAYDGFVTEYNGEIGTQGSSSAASGNSWTGSYGNSQTFTDWATGTLSSAINSPLWVNSTSTTQPTNNKTSGSLGSDNYGSTGTFSVTTNAPTACPSKLTTARMLLTGDVLSAADSVAMVAADNAIYSHLVNDTSNYHVYNSETHYLNWKQAYEAIRAGDVTAVDTALINFYLLNSNSNFRKYYDVDSMVSYNLFNAGLGANAAINTTNAIEQNQEIYNALLLKWLQNNHYNFSPNELNQLNTIANKCPASDGRAVYQSRALLSILMNDRIEFINTCTKGNDNAQKKLNENSKSNDEANDLFVLYPNPNNGTMQLLYALKSTEKAQLSIYDVTGKLSYQVSIDRNNNRRSIDIKDALREGLYYYKIESDDKLLKADKLIIIK